MDHGLEFIAALCAATPLAGGLLAGLMLAGLAGSAMHCVPMCGPFVLGQVADRMVRAPAVRLCELQRIRGGLLLPYHLGRITTYAGLGAPAGAMGATLSRLPWLGRLSGVLLLVAALLFLGQALRRLVPALHALLTDATAAAPGFVRLIAGLTRRLDRSTRAGGLLLGLALGFLPCGFLYAALTAASASGGPATGALAMVAFGLGTVPSLVAVGIAGQAAGRRWQRAAAAVAPSVMLLNAALLTALALRAIA
jgi:sulfite exporter TauE/SafE